MLFIMMVQHLIYSGVAKHEIASSVVCCIYDVLVKNRYKKMCLVAFYCVLKDYRAEYVVDTTIFIIRCP